MIVISDGSPQGFAYGGKTDNLELQRIIQKCKRDDFLIIGIGFGHDGVKDLYHYSIVINDNDKIIPATTALLKSVIKMELK
jgi:hypothetical protein